VELSDKGAELIANFEGFRSEPYWDVNHYSIGYGTRSHQGDGPITRAEGLARLQRQVEANYGAAVDQINKRHDLHLNQNQFDALTSFAFNLGPGVLDADRPVGRALRAKKWKDVAQYMLDYNRAGGQVLAGLTRRRETESKLFLRRPPVNYTDEEKEHLAKIKKKGKNPVAAAWLERQAVKIKRAAREDGKKGKSDWKTHDRGRRYQGIRRALRRYS
jgi:lysozyme